MTEIILHKRRKFIGQNKVKMCKLLKSRFCVFRPKIWLPYLWPCPGYGIEVKSHLDHGQTLTPPNSFSVVVIGTSTYFYFLK